MVAGWCLVAIYIAATVTTALSTGSVSAAAEAISGAALAVFVVLHTLTFYKPAGAAAYFATAVTMGLGLRRAVLRPASRSASTSITRKGLARSTFRWLSWRRG